MFVSAMSLRDACAHCGLRFVEEPGDLWAFIYLTTAGLTGVVIVAMLLVRPASLLGGRLVLASLAAALIVGTLPLRKGIGVAVDYLLREPDAREPARDAAGSPADVVSDGRESV